MVQIFSNKPNFQAIYLKQVKHKKKSGVNGNIWTLFRPMKDGCGCWAKELAWQTCALRNDDLKAKVLLHYSQICLDTPTELALTKKEQERCKIWTREKEDILDMANITACFFSK